MFSDVIKASFLFGVIATLFGVPLQLAALLLILLPVDSDLLNMARCAGIGLSLIMGPVLIGACAMKYRFTVPAYGVDKLQSLFTRTNKAYEAFWTANNRISCTLLASITMAFALSQVRASFDKETAVMLTALMIAVTFIVTVVLITHFRLKKANT